MAGRLSKMNSWSEVPGNNKTFSRRLSKVLDNIVFSPAQRDQSVKTMKTAEILVSFKNSISSLKSSHCIEDLELEDGLPCPVSSYICGSRFEGTTSLGLLSDSDSVNVINDLPVVTNRLDAQQYQLCFILVQDPNTPAGYTKLQLVFNGVPLFASKLKPRVDVTGINMGIDAKGRLVFRSDTEIKPFLTGMSSDRHGPAETFKPPYPCESVDLVSAFRGKTWPESAAEWLTRQRHQNWPTQSTIDKCKALSCFYVPVGHPNSREKHLECRISFSLQERLLVTSFNDVQLKCFVLLKMIKKEKIHKKLGEKSLTSYHFKTCMLHMIEKTPAEVWVEDNLLACLHNILYKMLEWVEAGECPNYFIPKENMFKGRLTRQLQEQLSHLLRSMDFKCLLDIECDDLGCRLQEALAFGDRPYISKYPEVKENMLVRHRTINILYRSLLRNLMFRLCEDKHIKVCLRRLYVMKSAVERTEMVTRDVLSLIVPYIDIMLMSLVTVLAKRLSKSSRFTFTMISEKWDAPCFDYYRSELKLKQASLMYMLGHNEMSLELLVAIEDQFRLQVSFCGCRSTLDEIAMTLELLVSTRSSWEAILSGHVIHCFVFLPAEGDLTPLALCYEMYRSIGSPPEGKQYWHDWAVVDGKVLLYFLLYLNHKQLGMEAHAAADRNNIWRLIQTDKLLGHRETAYNLLGWIYKERGLVDKAMKCFQESLAIRPTHNAALWLLACVLCENINSMNRETPSGP